jgi:hypothetical protein
MTKMQKMTTHLDELTAALNEQTNLLDKTDSLITEKTTVHAGSHIEANSSVIYSALTTTGLDLNEKTTTDLSLAINNFNISSSMVTSEIFTSQASMLTANVDSSTTTTMTTPTTITILTSTTTITIPTSTTTTTTLPTTVKNFHFWVQYKTH